MNKLKLKLKNTDSKFWDPTRADFVTGDEVIEVPDVPFWRRRVSDGTFEISGDSSSATKSEPKSGGKSSKKGGKSDSDTKFSSGAEGTDAKDAGLPGALGKDL